MTINVRARAPWCDPRARTFITGMVDPFPSPSSKFCRICRTSPADSGEHLIPSAIGGRRIVDGVLCGPCNSACGSGIDAALANKCLSMRVMLGMEGDRGQSPSLTVKDAEGTRVSLDGGMTARAAAGPPEVVDLGDGNFSRATSRRTTGPWATRSIR